MSYSISITGSHKQDAPQADQVAQDVENIAEAKKFVGSLEGVNSAYYNGTAGQTNLLDEIKKEG